MEQTRHAAVIEEIRHAAVIANNGWVVVGKSHFNCMEKIYHMGLFPEPSALAQGFVTNQGRFVGY